MNLTKKYLKQLIIEAFEELEEKKEKSTARSKAIAKALLSPPGAKSVKSTSKRAKEIFGTDKPKPRKAGEFKGYEDQPKINRGGGAAKLSPLPKHMEKHKKLFPAGKIKLPKKRKELPVTKLKEDDPPEWPEWQGKGSTASPPAKPDLTGLKKQKRGLKKVKFKKKPRAAPHKKKD